MTAETEQLVHNLVFIPILLSSVVGVAVAIGKAFALRWARVFPERFLADADGLIARRQFEEARTLCRTQDSPSARLLLAALETPGAPRAVLKERVLEAGGRVTRDLERGLDALGTISTLGPLFGLLGTIVGMVLIFRRAAEAEGIATPQELAGGISTALYATVAGLLLGIVALILHRYFLARADRIAGGLEELAFRTIDRLQGDETPAAGDRP